MKLALPIQITSGVFQLRVPGAKVTVVTDGDDVVLVDTGTRGSLKPIELGLRALELSLEQVRLIALTHYHPDHSGGLGRLVEATSAKVAAHRLEAGIVSGQDSVPSPYNNKMLANVTRPFIAPLYGAPVDVDYLLEDGDRLNVKKEVRVIHTPGHTPGSICLHVPSKGVLIVGDALRYLFRRLSPPAASVTKDPDQARESLKKLLPLQFDVICFGHHPPLREDAQGSLRRLVAKVDARAAETG